MKTLHACPWWCVAAMLLAWPAVADDWPQFLGVHRDGTWNEKATLQAFPAGGPPVLWRVPVGRGFASAAVAQDRVFVADLELNKPAVKERLLCLDEATGRQLWTRDYEISYPDWAFNPENGSGPVPTPIVEAGRVYMVGASGRIHCWDTITGAVVWDNDLLKKHKIRDLDCRASPLIEGNLLIFIIGAPGACVVALDKASGREVWAALDEQLINSSPLIVTAAGQRQLIVWTSQSISSLNPQTGEVLWSERLITSGNDGTSTPVVQGDLLLVGGLMMRLNADKPGATILWPDSKAVAKRVLSATSTAIMRDGCVYSCRGKGELVCLDAKTGRQLWQADHLTEPKKGAALHITTAGSQVLIYSDEGDLFLATLTPGGCQQTSRAHLIDPTFPFEGKNRVYALPSFANGCIFVRSDKEIVCAVLMEKP